MNQTNTRAGQQSADDLFGRENLTLRRSLSVMWTDSRRLLGLMRQASPGTLLWLGLAVVTEALAITALPWVTKLFIDAIPVAQATGAYLAPFLWLALEAAVVTARVAAGAGFRHGSRVLELTAGNFLTERILEKGCRVPYPQFESGEFLNRFSRARQDAPHYGVNYLMYVLGVARYALAFAGCLALLVWLAPWWTAPLIVMALVPQFLLDVRRARRSFTLERDHMDRNRQNWYLEWLLSTGEPMKEIRALGLGKWLIGLHERVQRPYRDGQIGLSAAHLRISNGLLLLSQAVIYLPYFVVAWSAVQGEITLGTLLFFILAFNGASGALSGLLHSLAGAFEHHLYVHNILDVLDMPESDSGAQPSSANVVASAPEFRIEDLWFAYPGGAPVLRGLTLTVRAGETLAIVGRNGVGKTTLVKLLLGLYTPEKGRIVIGGIDTATQPPEWQRDNIGVVFQDFVRFQFSARDAVGVGWSPAADELPRVLRAMQMSNADAVVSELPQGERSALGPSFGGRDLSGGQWQRLALARLFMRESRMWIMDEPTSAMDPETEERTFQCFRQWTEGRTAIIITHRFSTARIADRIAVVDDGRVAELGTHEELMALNGHYARIYEMQRQAFDTD